MIQWFKNNSKAYYVTVVTVLLFCLLAALPSKWSSAVNEIERDWHFNLRGNRIIENNIFFIYISNEDIVELGGWPISRDYYGFLIYALDKMGCRVIGLDLMFNQPDQLHPEFDMTLSEFINVSGKVCLPITFSELKITKSGELEGSDPNFPHSNFRESATGLGFSNLGSDLIIRNLPVVARQQSELVLSFGAELARHFFQSEKDFYSDGSIVGIADSSGQWRKLPLNQDGNFILNHFGSIDQLPSLSLVNFFKIYSENPDTLLVKDKLVFIAVTAPGRASLVSTPLNDLIPASLMHVTLAENIISERIINETGKYFGYVLILILCLISLLIILKFQTNKVLLIIPLLALGIWLIAHLIFVKTDWSINLLYPLSAFIVHSAAQFILIIIENRREQDSIRVLLNKQVEAKSRQLSQARKELRKLQGQLSNEEKISSESKQITDGQQEMIKRLETELRDLTSHDLPKLHMKKIPQFKDIVYSANSKLKDVLDEVSKISNYDIPVLILGETGTGKEMIARAIHQLSYRNSLAFIAVNCGALSETLLDSELFGHEKGSFTGAVTRRKGRFEVANGGTIFLDEITETSASFQAKLLRVLQEGTVERLGSEHTLHVDVRVIAATNRDLFTEQECGKFRADLYYRLNGYPVHLPSLKERISDIPVLCSHILQKYGFNTISGFSNQAMQILSAYHWPGNIRELENIIRRAAITAQGENRKEIRENDLSAELRIKRSEPKLTTIHKPLEDQILESLRALGFSRASIKQTAEHLGNKDRGTITEYFRGICFQHLVEFEFNFKRVVRSISDSDNQDIQNRIENKINEYLSNIYKVTSHASSERVESLFKGLPKKYHSFLSSIITHIKANGPLN